MLNSNSFYSCLQAIHGDVGQKQRDATLNAFRTGAFNVLVATDVAARGIDIQDVRIVCSCLVGRPSSLLFSSQRDHLFLQP